MNHSGGGAGVEQVDSEPCLPEFKSPYCHLLGVWYLGKFCNLSVTYRQKDLSSAGIYGVGQKFIWVFL